MRKIGFGLCRYSTARAFLAGAAILAGAATPAGAEPAEDMAFAVPRVSSGSLSGGVVLPHPLAPSEAEQIRLIFSRQAKGDLAGAAAEMAKITDDTLLGYMLADRYLGGPGRASPDDLQYWLSHYADLTDAPAIHAALLLLLPVGTIPPKAPPALAVPPPPPTEDVEVAVPLLPRHANLDRVVLAAARNGHPEQALRLIARTRGLGHVYGAVLRAEVAHVLFTLGRDAEALAIAEAAQAEGHGQVALASYVAGLASWRSGRPDLARPFFEAAYRAPLATPSQHAGAAFWAARAQLRTRNPGSYTVWLQRAAAVPRTFYGLLARRTMGEIIAPPAALNDAMLGEADIEAVGATPAGHRAFALLQVGQDARASAELRRLWAETRERPGFARSILMVARVAGLQRLADQLTPAVQPTAVRLPPSRFWPDGGFRTDPALLYALARMESNFDSKAVSPAGARGLMQLMPGTVEFLLGAAGQKRPRHIHDPSINLALGQLYLVSLSRYEAVGPDLIRMLASYNSGPTSFGRWAPGVRHDDDPLLFIESVPNDETRAYIPRVLTYTWLYAAQLRLPSPSLDELAAGLWPRFQTRVPRREQVAVLH